MHITLVGISHKTAPVAVREQFAFAPEELADALPRFGGAAVLLSTCNRTEVYLTSHHPITAGSVIALLRELKGAAEAPESAFYHQTGLQAARHLFRVAAGIESMVLGESEILGQVRAAFAAASGANTHNAVLSQLFHTAIRVGRRARSDTHIGRHAVSVSSTAVALARSTLGDLASRTVLVVSAGEAGKLAARSLSEHGASRLLVTNRRAARARELAAELGGAPVAFDRLGEAMAEADIVISSSAAQEFLIGPRAVGQAMAARNGRPLLLIDIAVPRDIDPAVRDLPQVHLYDIDDLQAVVDEHRNARRQEVAKVERIVEDGGRRFGEWLRARGVVPTVAALRERAEAVRQAELERTRKRLRGLSPKEQAALEAMASALVKKLLHDPIGRLKGDDGERYVGAVRELFGLDREGPGVNGRGDGEPAGTSVSGGRALVVGTRGSRLALRQTELVIEALRAAHSGLQLEVREVRTEGDRRSGESLARIGGQGVFVKELEAALLRGEIDLAVHSLKDVPAELASGLTLAAMPERGDPRDALVARGGAKLAGLPQGARVGTGSARRAVQLRVLRMDIEPVDIRGNVDTRVRKVEDGDVDAVVLAAAGLERLGLLDRASELFPPDTLVPAVGQGALAVEARADDGDVLALLGAIDHAETRQACEAERAFLRRLGGGCRLPFGALADVEGATVRVRGFIADMAGTRIVRASATGPAGDPKAAGVALAERLLEQGASAFVEV